MLPTVRLLCLLSRSAINMIIKGVKRVNASHSVEGLRNESPYHKPLAILTAIKATAYKIFLAFLGILSTSITNEKAH